MSIPVRRQANPLFGQPTLRAVNNGLTEWIRGETSPLDQKSSTGWLAKLTGGVQTGDDWARINFPVDEIFTHDFNYAQWSWYQTAAQTMGLGIVIWVHDPNDFDKRAEVTQLGGHADLPKAAGWNAFKFTPDTAGMFFYGENTTGTALTAGTQYAWSSFQGDVLFRNWTIYRITLEWGWEASGTFQAVYVADVKLNGVAVPLVPADDSFSGGTYHKSDTAVADTARRFETTSKKLRDIVIQVATYAQLFGDVTAQAYRVEAGETVGFTKVDVSTLYFKNATAGQNGIVRILAVVE